MEIDTYLDNLTTDIEYDFMYKEIKMFGKTSYKVRNTLTASSAVTVALAGLAPVTTRPSEIAKASHGPGGGTSIK